MDNKHTIYLGLGSNVGDRQAYLAAAVAAMPPEVTPVSCSRLYQTPAWGYTEQDAFLNQVVKAHTMLSPEDLLGFIKQLETDLGRNPRFRWGPREIDIDILFYDDLVYTCQGLTIPHPSLHERAFVLVPLADLAPEYIHPLLKQPVSELLKNADQSGIELYEGETQG